MHNCGMQRRAFSLVELSIVLVILGLLVGGILSGKSLIRSAQLRSILKERETFTTAVFSFRDKYFQLPGDMNNAYQFWGAACGTNTTTIATGCNGDGNGNIHYYNSPGPAEMGENIKAWEHLQRAGLVSGSYDGNGTVTAGFVELSLTNIPQSKFPEGWWTLSNNSNNIAAVNSMADFNEGSLLLTFGALDAGGIELITGTSLTHAEALTLDKKSDDGKADTGKMRGNNAGKCTESEGVGDYGANASLGGDPDMNDCTLSFILK